MALCTLSQVKQRLVIGELDTEHDAVLGRLIAGASTDLAMAAGQASLEKAARTQLLSVPESGTEHIWLASWPIVSITEVKEALYKDWDAATALTENTDYVADYARGRLTRVGNWLRGTLSVRVQYAGGYTRCDAWASGADYVIGDVVACAEAVYTCKADVSGGTTAPPDDADHWTLAAGEVPLPDDVTEAAIQQTCFYFQRKAELGLTGQSVQGASISTYARDELLPIVAQTMKRYGRLGG